MDQEIKKLLDAASENDKLELGIFWKAFNKTLTEYQNSPTKKNKQNLDAARDSLESKKQEMNQKYFGQDEQANGTPVFSSLLEVLKHLDNAGFRISKSKLYRDKDKAMIRVNPDGTVPETEVRAYASTLERKDGNIDDLSDIHAQKTKKEVEKLEEQIAKARFEREKEEGKYIPKKDFEAELAARAATLDAGFRHLFNSRVREWVNLVNGDVKKSADFLQDLNNSLNELLNQYAVTDSFSVIFTGEE